MKAAKDRWEEYYDPVHKEKYFGMGKDTTGPVGRTPQRPNHSLGLSVEVLGESPLRLTFGSKRFVESRVNCNVLQLCGHQDFAKDVRRAVLGRRLALLGPVCGEVWSSGSQSPDLRDMWRHGRPMIQEWISSRSTSETSFGDEEYEHNNECRAIGAGLVKRGGSALFRGLGARASGIELPHGNGPYLPRNEGMRVG